MADPLTPQGNQPVAFRPPKWIPGLEGDAHRQIVAAFEQIARVLGALSARQTITPILTADYHAARGELVRANPPASNMCVRLPQGTEENKGQRVNDDVVSVASGGSVSVVVIDGQPIDGSSSKTLSSVGCAEFVSLGTVGWGC